MQSAPLAKRFDLGEYLAAGIMRGERDGMGVEIGRLAMEGQIAARVGLGRPDQREIDAQRLVAQIFAPIEGQ